MNERKYSVTSIGLRIDGFLQETFQNGGFDLRYEIEDVTAGDDAFETPDVAVKFSGPDVDLVLSNRAELLLALEHVTMEMLRVSSEDHSRISFDANDYRLLRIEELRMSAAAAAENVKRTGVPFRFNPMNSRERRVIHLSLRNESELRSESCGAGPGRHVVIYPAGMASLPEPPPPIYSAPRAGPPRGDRGGDRGRDRGGDRGRDRGGRPPRR